MAEPLVLSTDLRLPLRAITETFGILAARGAGKSNTAAVMAEEMFKAKLPFVVVDPARAWWGLRASRDGTGPGLPIPIFGGQHGDVPLERSGGALVADLVVEHRLSCVLDITEFDSEGAKKAFLLDFARRLYQKNEEPLHLFLEEADDYIPQRPMRDEAQLLRAWENIVRRGRNRGLGMTLITQRSAAINKSVLTQVGTLIAMRTTGPQDRSAIEDWLKYHDQSREILASLPSLANGEAWVWSPQFLGKTVRVHMRRRDTFDSGATPTAKASKRTPATLADVDLVSVKVKMAATIERTKAEDPKALRAELAKVKAELVKVQAAPAAMAKERRVDVPMLKAGQVKQLEYLAGRMEAILKQFDRWQAAFEARGQDVRAAATEISAALQAALRPRLDALPPGVKSTLSRPHPARVVAGPGDETVGSGGLRRILVALAQRPQGLTLAQIGVRAGLSSRSGTFSTYMSRGRQREWIHDGGPGGVSTITDTGLQALGSYEPLPTGRDLLNHWLQELGTSGAARILQALADAYPAALTLEQLGERANLNPRSGTFSTYLSRLRTLQLIEGRGQVRASEELA